MQTQRTYKGQYRTYLSNPDAPGAQGGQGTLFQGWYDETDAYDCTVTKKVAIKILNDESTKVFLDKEASALIRLDDHPAIPRYRDQGVSGKKRFLVSDYVEGYNLDKIQSFLDRKFLAKEIVSIGIDTAKGLEYVHAKSIIHRDIAPTNLMIDEGGRLKIVDFGCASLRYLGNKTSLNLGQKRYQAPELAAGRPATPAADVYSLGAILGELAEKAESLPEAVQELIARCCQLDPKDRPSAGQIVEQLKPHLEGDRSDCLKELLSRVESNQVLSLPWSATTDSGESQTATRPKSKKDKLLVGLLVIFAILFYFWFALRAQESTIESVPAPTPKQPMMVLPQSLQAKEPVNPKKFTRRESLEPKVRVRPNKQKSTPGKDLLAKQQAIPKKPPAGEPKWGQLKVDANALIVRVFLNDEYYGLTPMNQRLKPGPYDVRVVYQREPGVTMTKRYKVDVEPGETMQLKATFAE